MTINYVLSFFVAAEFSILLIFYFSMYNPIKRKETSLTDKQKLTQIKRYFLRSSLTEMRFFLKVMLILFLFSLIPFIFFPDTSPWNIIRWVILFAVFLFYVIISTVLFTSYIKVHRNREAIYNAKNFNEIWRIIKIKEKYFKKVSSMLDLTWKTQEKEKDLASWFLDSLNWGDSRIIK